MLVRAGKCINSCFTLESMKKVFFPEITNWKIMKMNGKYTGRVSFPLHFGLIAGIYRY